MALSERNKLAVSLTPPLDNLLASQLVDEYSSIERRFIQRDWEPAELDGGQFCEILARIFYHQDSNNLNHRKDFDDCCKYIENEQIPHAISPRSDALHMIRILRTAYKFRSQRGAVHISPNYGPNELDSKLIISCVRWAFAETLRIYSQKTREEIAVLIREILQFDVPCIGKFNDVIIVQRTDLSSEQEVLLLLHFAGDQGMSRLDVGRYAKVSAPAVTNSLKRLTSPEFRQIIQLSSGNYRLTDLGARRVRNELADKLAI